MLLSSSASIEDSSNRVGEEAVPVASRQVEMQSRPGCLLLVSSVGRSRSDMPGLIEDYAIIGNCESAALVGRDGSIDWLALPRFDSAACFAALLGDPENGRWQIAPKGEAQITRRCRDG